MDLPLPHTHTRITTTFTYDSGSSQQTAVVVDENGHETLLPLPAPTTDGNTATPTTLVVFEPDAHETILPAPITTGVAPTPTTLVPTTWSFAAPTQATTTGYPLHPTFSPGDDFYNQPKSWYTSDFCALLTGFFGILAIAGFLGMGWCIWKGILDWKLNFQCPDGHPDAEEEDGQTFWDADTNPLVRAHAYQSYHDVLEYEPRTSIEDDLEPEPRQLAWWQAVQLQSRNQPSTAESLPRYVYRAEQNANLAEAGFAGATVTRLEERRVVTGWEHAERLRRQLNAELEGSRAVEVERRMRRAGML